MKSRNTSGSIGSIFCIMPHLTFKTSPDGFALDVLIGLTGKDSAGLVAKGQRIPPPMLVRALIDTGTDVTCVATRVVQHFSLAFVAQVGTQTAAGPVSRKLFEVSLGIPKSGRLTGPLLVLEHLLVMELTPAPPNVEVLIGNDVLLHCLLIIDGPGGTFTLST
jgi:hypothetical protein